MTRQKGACFARQARAGKALGRGVPNVVEVGIAAGRGELAGQEQGERQTQANGQANKVTQAKKQASTCLPGGSSSLRFLFIRSAENDVVAAADGDGGAVRRRPSLSMQASSSFEVHAGHASKCLPGDVGFAHHKQTGKESNLFGGSWQILVVADGAGGDGA